MIVEQFYVEVSCIPGLFLHHVGVPRLAQRYFVVLWGPLLVQLDQQLDQFCRKSENKCWPPGDCRSHGWHFIETPQECRVAANEFGIALRTKHHWPAEILPESLMKGISRQVRAQIGSYSGQQREAITNLFKAGNIDPSRLKLFRYLDTKNRIFWGAQRFCGTQDEDQVVWTAYNMGRTEDGCVVIITWRTRITRSIKSSRRHLGVNVTIP